MIVSLIKLLEIGIKLSSLEDQHIVQTAVKFLMHFHVIFHIYLI